MDRQQPINNLARADIFVKAAYQPAVRCTNSFYDSLVRSTVHSDQEARDANQQRPGLLTYLWREAVRQAKHMSVTERDSLGFSTDYGTDPFDHPDTLEEFMDSILILSFLQLRAVRVAS